MNDITDSTLIGHYLDELSLDAERQQALARDLADGGDLAALHHALQVPGETALESVGETRELLESVPARLALGWPDAVERGCRLVKDHQGRPTIESPGDPAE